MNCFRLPLRAFGVNNLPSCLTCLTHNVNQAKELTVSVLSVSGAEVCYRAVTLCKGLYYHFGKIYKSQMLIDINLLKPTGHVMHQQFSIQQLYVLPTLYLCVLYLSENKQRLVPLTA